MHWLNLSWNISPAMCTREGLSFVLSDRWNHFHSNLCQAYDKTTNVSILSVFIIYLCGHENVSKEQAIHVFRRCRSQKTLLRLTGLNIGWKLSLYWQESLIGPRIRHSTKCSYRCVCSVLLKEINHTLRLIIRSFSISLQADGTAWMAFYCILMLKIALILAEKDDTYQEIASKFFEHFTQISDAINEMSSGLGLWDEQDGFYYDHLSAGTSSEALRVRSMVGLVPLMACLVLDNEYIKTLPVFKKRVEWFMKNRKDLATQVSDPEFMKKNLLHDICNI